MTDVHEKTGPAGTGPVEIQTNPRMGTERTEPIMTQNNDKTNIVGAVPTWAVDVEPSGEGFLFARRAETYVRDAGDERSVSVELVQSAQLEVEDGQIKVSLGDVGIILGVDSVDIDGARDLIWALTELVEAYEESEPAAVGDSEAR